MDSVFGLFLVAISGMFNLFGRFFTALDMGSWFFAFITFIAVAMFLVKPLIGYLSSRSRSGGSRSRDSSKGGD